MTAPNHALYDWLQEHTDAGRSPSVYLSGPMTGYEEYNFPAFHKATDKLREAGFLVTSPAELDGEVPGLPDEKYGKEYIEFLTRDVEHVVAVDGIVVLPGWQQSRGARFEVMIAVGLDKPVFDITTGDLIRIEQKDNIRHVDENILEEAGRLVSGSRGPDYGHPYDDFGRQAAIISVVLGHPVSAHQVPMIMMAVKLSRHVNRPKRDNMVDIAGYARTAEMVAEREGEWK